MIRLNHIGFKPADNLVMDTENATGKGWMNLMGTKSVTFKVIVERTENGFFKSTDFLDTMIMAEVKKNKPVTFKFKKVENDKVAPPFTKFTAKNIELSM